MNISVCLSNLNFPELCGSMGGVSSLRVSGMTAGYMQTVLCAPALGILWCLLLGDLNWPMASSCEVSGAVGTPQHLFKLQVFGRLYSGLTPRKQDPVTSESYVEAKAGQRDRKYQLDSRRRGWKGV